MVRTTRDTDAADVWGPQVSRGARAVEGWATREEGMGRVQGNN
jgi:hypothetical protein